MGDSYFDTERPFAASGHRAAAVLCRTEHQNLHIGVLFLDEALGPCVLHLGWQDHLSLDWRWNRLWATPAAPPEKLRSVAGYCRRVWRHFEQTGSFPYALGAMDAAFDSQGRLRLQVGSQGLTCATFVLAIFRTAQVRLVEEGTWPAREAEDRLFLESIRHFAHPDHFALLQAQVDQGVARIHPQEVLGACTLEVIPAIFEVVRGAAEGVVQRLEGGPTATM